MIPDITQVILSTVGKKDCVRSQKKICEEGFKHPGLVVGSGGSQNRLRYCKITYSF